MKKLLLLSLCAAFLFTACGDDAKSDDDKKDDKKTEKKVNDAVPNIDLASLTTEEAVLAAMTEVVDARMKDDKMSDEDPDYEGNYASLTTLYADVLGKSTEFMSTLEGQAALDFNDKISAITDKMYE